MRLEPLKQPSDPIALVAVVCGVAPLPLSLFAILPFFGLLATPLSALSVLGAIGCGIAGVVRAKKQPEPNYVLPLTGVVLGLLWVMLIAGVVVYFSRRD